MPRIHAARTRWRSASDSIAATSSSPRSRRAMIFRDFLLSKTIIFARVHSTAASLRGGLAEGPVSGYKGRPMAMPVTVETLPEHVNEEIELRGWLYNMRSSGKLHFLE